MQTITSNQLAKILNCNYSSENIEIKRISTDSRNVDENTLFIALKGIHFDGHDFVKDVINKGCPLVVVTHQIDNISINKQLIVDDTLKAYGKIAAYNRSLFKGKVIGLTGSSGKTTTKEEIAFLLSKFAKTYATSGNHNNAVGVPQSLCELDMTAEYAVIEMGMSAKGEISYLTDLVKPDIAVVTNVYPMHIEFFESLEAIAYAKAEIFEGLPPTNGIAIINEDTNFAGILQAQAQRYAQKIIKFGKKHHISDNFTIQGIGEHFLYNAWCSLAVIEALGLDINKAALCIKDFGALDGRGKQHILKLFNGDKYTLIDDSYSGQPEAMKIAIESLDKIKHNGRKIAVLGKMAELGETSKVQHETIGKLLKNTSIDLLPRKTSDESHYYIIQSEKMYDLTAELKKTISRNSDLSVQHANSLSLNDVDKGTVNFEYFESYYSWSSSQILCPKGNYKPYKVTDTGYEVISYNDSWIQSDKTDLKCYYHRSGSHHLFSYYLINGENYFTKDSDSNYLLYSNILWRIIKTNSDNSITLISDKAVSSLAFGKNKDFSDSYINKWLNKDSHEYSGILEKSLNNSMILDCASVTTVSNLSCNSSFLGSVF